ncbi:phage portal protein [uncultured Citricoccus sp.]|uniref:phage portal protein n=1 Tax=uncultured Citricoccus sp. TaxID=614031 RepID=UPI002623FE87|nr:phage portal protein [uncultured Citricoccus sp.]
MTDIDILTGLLQQLDERAGEHTRSVAYYEGRQGITMLAPEIRQALNNRLQAVSVNVPRLLVDSIAERLRIVGFRASQDVWADWLANDLDVQARYVHKEALLLGDCFVIVWADAAGRPLVSVESATQVAAEIDPATRQLVRAVKRWEDKTSTHAVLYERDRIVRFRADSTGATTLGFRTVETLANPFGRPPVVRFRNGDRLLSSGISEMTDVLPLTDALVKLTTDLLTASEYGARPRRWATGLELTEDDQGNEINPIPEGDRAMVSESPETKFGQLDGSDLAGYENAIGVTMRLISAVSGLPEHMLGIGGDNPTSADSIRASEAALTAKAEARQATFGKAWADVARLMIATRTGLDPAGIDAAPIWADAGTRSIAQEADAITKLHAQGLITTDEARAKLGIQ